jgi:hypothetical protein
VRALVVGLGLSFLAADAVMACTVAWTPPPRAEMLERQVRERERPGASIVLARVVNIDLADGSKVQLFNHVVRLDDEAWTGGAGLVPDTLCGQRFAAGDMVLVYYELLDPIDRNYEHRTRLVVSVDHNADPEIALLLDSAARRLRQRAKNIRERAQARQTND